MPYDLYWNGPPNAFFFYIEKTRIEYERRRKELDLSCWLMGSYTRDAILSIYRALNPMVNKNAKDFPYPEKPREALREEEKRRTEEEKRRKIYDQISAWANNIKGRRKRFKGKEEEIDG